MNLILHYDESLDLEFEIPELIAAGHPDIPSFLEAHQSEVNEAMLSALHTAIDMSLSCVPVFVIKGVDEVFNIKREEFQRQCDRLLEYYSGLEEFELCIVLQQLKAKL
jgi:hypothetical protein